MPDDEATVPETAPESVEEPAAPEAEPDSTMEVADAEATSDPAATEVGTVLEADADPAVIDPTPDPLDNPAPETADADADADEDEDEEDAEEEAEEDDEPNVAKNQANYQPPPGLSQADYVQGLMVAGNNQGNEQRRATIARNRERRAQQHAAIHGSDQG